MLIGGHDFSPGVQIDVARLPDGHAVLDTPHTRYANAKNLPLHTYGQGPFVQLKVSGLPRHAGVYAVVRNWQDVLYIGRAARLDR